ncbi:aspartate/glutamate racemase family protein [Brevibacillus choshinensis]|uniref:aspartate/glutamate racemase family protein n=1 Tax=Brevibacillus choshinensis TaxID=54911 RepID=UPI002E24C628|nr:aspartate/glutamate racemase family protein [Brevibacillus choshinensis]MED4581178.1 aspartate/glutamate racemase family protein [Brevibacillus choshinensis]
MGTSPTRIGLIHATMNSVQPIHEAFRAQAPHVILLNFMDEGLIFELNETGVITTAMIRRLVALIARAEESGVDGILLTCSSFSPYVPQIRSLFSTPVVSADTSMLEYAVSTAQRIGVIATVGTAGPITTQQLQEIAIEQGKTVEVQTEVITEAFVALQNGEKAQHDVLIHQKIRELSVTNEVILLAQMSMARALWSLAEPPSRPVLTSPEISIRTILHLLERKRVARS